MRKYDTGYMKGVIIGEFKNRTLLDVSIEDDAVSLMTFGLNICFDKNTPVFIGLTLFGKTMYLTLWETTNEQWRPLA